MVKPLSLSVDGIEIENITSLTVHRSRRALTGEIVFSIFIPEMPNKPPIAQAVKSKPILISINGVPFMTGFLDKRRNSARLQVDQQSYQVDIAARGSTKYALDSAYVKKKLNVEGKTVQEVVRALLSPYKVKMEWQAQNYEIPSGWVVQVNACTISEINRLLENFQLFAYEGPDGTLIVADNPVAATGGDAIPIDQILSYSIESDEEFDYNMVAINGVNLEFRGRNAVLPEMGNQYIAEKAKKEDGQRLRPIRRQGYGKDQQRIRNPAKAAKWSGKCSNLTLTMMGFVDGTGQPWRLNKTYTVTLPLEELVNQEIILDEIQLRADNKNQAIVQLGFAFTNSQGSDDSDVTVSPSKTAPSRKDDGDFVRTSSQWGQDGIIQEADLPDPVPIDVSQPSFIIKDSIGIEDAIPDEGNTSIGGNADASVVKNPER